MTIKFNLNGKVISANQDETILKAAQRHGENAFAFNLYHAGSTVTRFAIFT